MTSIKAVTDSISSGRHASAVALVRPANAEWSQVAVIRRPWAAASATGFDFVDPGDGLQPPERGFARSRMLTLGVPVTAGLPKVELGPRRRVRRADHLPQAPTALLAPAI